MSNPIEGFMGSVQSGAATGVLTAIGAVIAVLGVFWTSFPTVRTGETGVRTLLGRVWIRKRRYRLLKIKRVWTPVTVCNGQKWQVYLLLIIPFWRRRTRHPTVPEPFEVDPGIKFAPYGVTGVINVSNQVREMDLNGFDADVTCADGHVRQWRVEARVFWRVPKRKFMATRSVVRGQNGLDGLVRDVCAEAIRSAYSTGYLQESALRDADMVLAAISPLVRGRLAVYGVQLEALILVQTARSFGQMVRESRSELAPVLAAAHAA